MHIQFSKNVHFTKLLKASDRLREFNFRLIPGASNLFHVDVPDDRGNRIMFKMQRSDNANWTIVDQQLPQWVYNSEQSLNNLIQEEVH